MIIHIIHIYHSSTYTSFYLENNKNDSIIIIQNYYILFIYSSKSCTFPINAIQSSVLICATSFFIFRSNNQGTCSVVFFLWGWDSKTRAWYMLLILIQFFCINKSNEWPGEKYSDRR